MIATVRKSRHTTRLLACLFGGFVLCLMLGNQEGSQTDELAAFKQAVAGFRLPLFLLLGVAAFCLLSFGPLVRPYLTRPGSWPLISGVLTVGASLGLLHWDDAIADPKFAGVSKIVGQTSGISALPAKFFAWGYWVQLLVVVAACAAAIATRRVIIGYLAAVLAVLSALNSYLAYNDVIKYVPNTIDHSTGVYVSVVGYVVLAAAGLSAVLSADEISRRTEYVSGVLGWRPGLVLVVVGALISVFGMTVVAWYSPAHYNARMHGTHILFAPTAASKIALADLQWLGWVLLVVAVVLAGVGTFLRTRPVAIAATVVGAAGSLITVITLHSISKVGAKLHVDSATGPWQNLGAGGWVTALGLFLIGSGALVAATTPPPPIGVDRSPRALRQPSRLGLGAKFTGQYKSLILAGLAFALFYPPTATQFWQKVLVTEVGVYVLLAVGLNVVVGWAGLLDLGFIAFFAIGSYTTAYLVGALPVQPPSWLHLTPLLAIPFAVALCLVAGLTLGAPTLRLRGDYLAIVTLGFGEIIRIIAINNPGDFTNGPRGAPDIPHPTIHLGPIHWVWGLDSLPYWYLLLIIVIIVVALFYRLEGSRLGRAWAAVREDEVAAQATGINTTQVKLMAFAIGASTSGIAGVFFATQVGYINPDNFVLNNSILVVAYVVFGGMGSLSGALAGAAVLTWLPEFLKDQVPADDRQMWIGAIVLLMMIFRPEGLIPARRRKAELHGLDDGSSAETRAVPSGEGLGARA